MGNRQGNRTRCEDQTDEPAFELLPWWGGHDSWARTNAQRLKRTTARDHRHLVPCYQENLARHAMRHLGRIDAPDQLLFITATFSRFTKGIPAYANQFRRFVDEFSPLPWYYSRMHRRPGYARLPVWRERNYVFVIDFDNRSAPFLHGVIRGADLMTNSALKSWEEAWGVMAGGQALCYAGLSSIIPYFFHRFCTMNGTVRVLFTEGLGESRSRRVCGCSIEDGECFG